MNSLPDYSFKLASSIPHDISCFELSPHTLAKKILHQQHTWNASIQFLEKRKSLSSTIRSAKRAIGRPKDGRKETVYAAVINDQTDFRERKTHWQPVSSPPFCQTPNAGKTEGWIRAHYGWVQKKILLRTNNLTSLPSVAVGDWRSRSLPAEWMDVAKQAAD